VEDDGSGTIGGCDGYGNWFADRVRVANQFADRVFCVLRQRREKELGYETPKIPLKWL
jgi:hypothetical protein